MTLPLNATYRMSFADLAGTYLRQEWGFTGTRKGMTLEQKAFGRRMMETGKPTRFVHGGAYGSDFEMHAIWRESRIPGMCHVWPASEERAQLFRDQPRVVVHQVMTPLDRNVEVVNHCALLVSAPHTQKEEQRSGTWHTIRIGFRERRPVLLLWPNGLLTLCLEQKLIRING